MTRINLIHPRYLTREHLIAEYRELPRVFTLINAAHQKGKTIKDYKIPHHYVLGKGHVTFFYNKAGYLIKRWVFLRREMMDRGFKVDFDYIQHVKESYRQLPDWAFATKYTPSPEEVYLNMHRLVQRHFKPKDEE